MIKAGRWLYMEVWSWQTNTKHKVGFVLFYYVLFRFITFIAQTSKYNVLQKGNLEQARKPH